MSTNPFALKNKKVLLTQADSAAGIAMALLFAEMEAVVTLVGRNQSEMVSLVDKMLGSNHSIILSEIANFNPVDNFLKTEMAKFDAIVLLPDIIAKGSFLDTEEAILSNIIKSNVELPLALCRSMINNKFIANQCSIVFVTSVWGLNIGAEEYSAHGIVTGALIAATRAMALELAPLGVRVNTVNAGEIAPPNTPKELEGISAASLWDGTNEDIAHAVGYMLTEASKWVTGSVLTVDGGYSMS